MKFVRMGRSNAFRYVQTGSHKKNLAEKVAVFQSVLHELSNDTLGRLKCLLYRLHIVAFVLDFNPSRCAVK